MKSGEEKAMKKPHYQDGKCSQYVRLGKFANTDSGVFSLFLPSFFILWRSNQAVKTGKNRVQNAYDQDDWVQKNGGDDGFLSPVYSFGEYGNADQKINNPKVKNVEVDAPGEGGLTEHTNMDSADVIKQLEDSKYREKKLEDDKNNKNPKYR